MTVISPAGSRPGSPWASIMATQAAIYRTACVAACLVGTRVLLDIS
jgi:hypothetical protein